MPAWTIVAASANTGDFLGVEAPHLIDKPLDVVLAAKTIHDLRNVLQSAMVSNSVERFDDVRIGDREPSYDLNLHMAGAHATIEFIPRQDVDTLTTDPMTLVKNIIARLRRAPNLDRFFGSAAQQMRSITGFDRVMIYKFLDDGSGQVVAEALRSDLTPFLDMRYPASDIPAQARALYKRQSLRLIPDINYVPVPLIVSPSHAGEIDLSLATLRSVSPVHRDHLRNMSSVATLTVSILEGDRLWGLIASHHDRPRRVSASICAAAQLLGQIVSLQIGEKQHAQEQRYAARSRAAHDRLLGGMSPELTIFDDLGRFAAMLPDLIPCDGVGVWSERGFAYQGLAPSEAAVGDLVRLLDGQSATEPFATHALAEFLPSAASYAADCSGVLALPFSSLPRYYLMFYRREVVQTVTWGGDPNKAVEVTGAGQRPGPGKSFEAWHQTVNGQSMPWRPSELQIAERLRVSMLDLMLRRADKAARERRPMN